MTKIQHAQQVAKILSRRFLVNGSYSASAGPIGTSKAGMSLAAEKREDGVWENTAGFAGIAVQAVGVEVGKTDPRVFIYASKGSQRAFKALPEELDGVGVVVRKIGMVDIRPDLASGSAGQPHLFQRNNRIACGSSCAPAAEDYAGTFGAIVKRDEKLYVLSNNHVLAACNHTPIDMPILAPASIDAGPNLRAPGEIARHTQIVALRSGDPMLVVPCQEDVAIAEVKNQNVVTSWQGDNNGYDTPNSTAAPIAEMRVKKVGRTTGLTTGIVEAKITEPTPIPCQTRFFKGTVWFCDMWYVLGDQGEFALQGDSGSLVVTEDGVHAVGILFSTNRTGEYGLIIPIDQVLKQFGGIQLVSNHGV